MTQHPKTSGAFLDFSDLLTGYRLSEVLLTIEESGLFAFLGLEGALAHEICRHTGWHGEYGERFLQCLCALGLLQAVNERYIPSRFSQQYLLSGFDSQGATLAFEQKLRRNWQSLNATLKAGCRVTGTAAKTAAVLRQARVLYLGAMDEAAAIRAGELWQALTRLPAQGVLLDIGAGAGTYLAAFLGRHPGWSAIYCDLPEIASSRELHPRLNKLHHRLRWCGCNLLDPHDPAFAAIDNHSADLIMLSNIIHCQGREETTLLLGKAATKASRKGLFIIHDFFLDRGWRGALYDLHMMINTATGRTYRTSELVEIMAIHGWRYHAARQLPSDSTLLAFACSRDILDQALPPQPGGASSASRP